MLCKVKEVLQKTYKKAIDLKNFYKGYISTKELLKEGFTNRQINILVQEKYLERVACGQYWLLCCENEKPKEYKALEIYRDNPDAIITGSSALYYYHYVDEEPETLTIVTKRSDRKKSTVNFSVERHYCSDIQFDKDALRKKTAYGTYNISSVEKSLCDYIYYKNYTELRDISVLIERIQNQKSESMNRFMMYAKQLHIENRIQKML